MLAPRTKKAARTEGSALAPQNEWKRRTWLSVRNGEIEATHPDKRKTLHAYIEGFLINVRKEHRTYQGEEVIRWFINLRDSEGKIYSIGFPYNSGTFKSIVLSLASCETLNTATLVHIEPYLKNGYSNVMVKANNEKLNWLTKELPPCEYIKRGVEKVKDYTKRMEYITSLCEGINSKLN